MRFGRSGQYLPYTACPLIVIGDEACAITLDLFNPIYVIPGMRVSDGRVKNSPGRN